MQVASRTLTTGITSSCPPPPLLQSLEQKPPDSPSTASSNCKSHFNYFITEVFHYRSIRALLIADANFETAWKVFIDQFVNQIFIVSLHVEALLDTLLLLTIITENVAALEALEMPVHPWDLIQLPILCKKLDVSIQILSCLFCQGSSLSCRNIANPRKLFHNFAMASLQVSLDRNPVSSVRQPLSILNSQLHYRVMIRCRHFLTAASVSFIGISPTPRNVLQAILLRCCSSQILREALKLSEPSRNPSVSPVSSQRNVLSIWDWLDVKLYCLSTVAHRHLCNTPVSIDNPQLSLTVFVQLKITTSLPTAPPLFTWPIYIMLITILVFQKGLNFDWGGPKELIDLAKEGEFNLRNLASNEPDLLS
ncbi:hypothetical protein PR048_009417 [Dryococelus australis]|uniref:Uncharacterized protein n=1 Tax=Dryococelus australis TaxID=614101 RepID=A0ABQ9I075_9NEOP|nr:hypothetical protein PR048_009417 [Dryococelus australis]